MKIDGKLIAEEIKRSLLEKVRFLKTKGITLHLAVIFAGNNQSSQTYIRQKQKVGGEIGVEVEVIQIHDSKDPKSQKEALTELANKLNSDRKTQGIIIQRPVAFAIRHEELDNLVIPQKDVDGFHPKSSVSPPVAEAIIKILRWTEDDICSNPNSALKQSYCEPFSAWLKKQRILVIGRGETAGKPIANTLIKRNNQVIVAHSHTPSLKDLCLQSNIIISCVGKPNIVRLDMLTDKTILIGVGLFSEKGKLKTDYNQEEIAGKVAYWTPVPGGVGPVNVACLFENLLKLASR